MEDHIRQDILRLLDELSVESISPYPTDDGPADIYLPRLRLFLKLKLAGLPTILTYDNPETTMKLPKSNLNGIFLVK